MILIKRKSYNAWETIHGDVIYGSTRFTSLPLVTHLVEYDKTGEILNVLKWDRKKHDEFYSGTGDIYDDDIHRYPYKISREIAIYASLIPRNVSSTEQSWHDRMVFGNIDPAILMTHDDLVTEQPDLIRDAYIIYNFRYSMKLHGKIWLKREQILNILIKSLETNLAKLVGAGIFCFKGEDDIAFTWAAKKSMPFEGHPAPKHRVGEKPSRKPGKEHADYTMAIDHWVDSHQVVSIMVYDTPPEAMLLPEFISYDVPFENLRQMLEVDGKNSEKDEVRDYKKKKADGEEPPPKKPRKRTIKDEADGDEIDDEKRILVVSDQALRHLQPKDSKVVRLLCDHENFKKNEIVTIQSFSSKNYVMKGGTRRNVKLTHVNEAFVYNWTNPAATETFENLVHIPSNAGYDGMVVIKRPRHSKWYFECLRIMGGDANKVFVLDKEQSVVLVNEETEEGTTKTEENT